MFEKLIPNAIPSYSRVVNLQQNEGAEHLGFRPDLITTYTEVRKGLSTEKTMTHNIHPLNILGYIPLVSTVTGGYRTLTGVALAVASLFRYYFDISNMDRHREGLKIAGANIGRGLVEMVPVMGNLFTLNIDASRLMARWASVTGIYGNWCNEIHLLNFADAVGAVPLIGTIVNLGRTIFFLPNVAVNLIPAIVTGKEKYSIAAKYGALQVGIGLVESIPGVGTFSALLRQMPIPYVDDFDDNPFSEQ